MKEDTIRIQSGYNQSTQMLVRNIEESPKRVCLTQASIGKPVYRGPVAEFNGAKQRRRPMEFDPFEIPALPGSL